MSSVKNRVRLFEKPKEPSNVANKTYSFSRTNKFNKNVPNKLNINTTAYNNIISTTNNKVNIDSSAGKSNNVNKSQVNAKATATTTATTTTTTVIATTNNDSDITK